jgi:hypothetical protein
MQGFSQVQHGTTYVILDTFQLPHVLHEIVNSESSAMSNDGPTSRRFLAKSISPFVARILYGPVWEDPEVKMVYHGWQLSFQVLAGWVIAGKRLLAGELNCLCFIQLVHLFSQAKKTLECFVHHDAKDGSAVIASLIHSFFLNQSKIQRLEQLA